MIRLEPYEPELEHGITGHFVVRSDEPIRVSVTNIHGRVVAHVYRGFNDDVDQDPVGVFDGFDTNRAWESLGTEEEDR